MPSRSTPFQSIVRLVREHFAQPGVTVTESKHLRDAVTGSSREVDVVIEGDVDGEPILVSVEVIEHSRKADVTWTEQIIAKHRNLPTNRLLLVSKAGFSRQALVLVDKEAGRVQALTPEAVEPKSGDPAKDLYIDQFGAHPTGCKAILVADGEKVEVGCPADLDVYSETGELLGPMHRLVREILDHPDVVKHLSIMARNHPEREDVQGFSAGFAIIGAGYHLQHSETDALHLIVALEAWGKFSWTQTALRFALNRLDKRVYGAATGPMAGRPAVWVATSHEDTQQTKVSWQWIDNRSALPSVDESCENLFPAIRELSFSDPPADPPDA